SHEGFKLLSGYRSPSVHASFGEVSGHPKGNAVDVRGAEKLTDKELAKAGLYRPWSSRQERNHLQLMGSPKRFFGNYDMSDPEQRRRASEIGGPLPKPPAAAAKSDARQREHESFLSL